MDGNNLMLTDSVNSASTKFKKKSVFLVISISLKLKLYI